MISRLFICLATAWAIAASPASSRTDAPDGTLLSSKPCPLNPVGSHERYIDSARAYFAEEVANAANEGLVMPLVPDDMLVQLLDDRGTVESHIAYEGFECLEITYASDGLTIAGFLWKPDTIGEEKMPLVIANRGGNADFGPMRPWHNWGWHDFLRAGYVVLASQYRGGPGSEGLDEFGGRDLDDVRALLPLAENLGFVDTRNIFAFGESRGGMTTYMLARGKSPFKAIAIRSGLGNAYRLVESRPIFDTMVFPARIPDYAEKREEALTARSASMWADEIAAPAIIFHGSDDWRVSPSDAVTIAGKMMTAGIPVELHLYHGDTHSITLNRTDMLARTIAFFDRFRIP